MTCYLVIIYFCYNNIIIEEFRHGSLCIVKTKNVFTYYYSMLKKKQDKKNIALSSKHGIVYLAQQIIILLL